MKCPKMHPMSRLSKYILIMLHHQLQKGKESNIMNKQQGLWEAIVRGRGENKIKDMAAMLI